MRIEVESGNDRLERRLWRFEVEMVGHRETPLCRLRYYARQTRESPRHKWRAVKGEEWDGHSFSDRDRLANARDLDAIPECDPQALRGQVLLSIANMEPEYPDLAGVRAKQEAESRRWRGL